MEENSVTWEEALSSAKWVATTPENHPWMRALDERERMDAEVSALNAYFVPKGLRWPLFSIAVYLVWPSKRDFGVKIAFGVKEGANKWWRECTLPPSLVPNLIELLKQADEANRKMVKG